jgi:hypothetical protein
MDDPPASAFDVYNSQAGNYARRRPVENSLKVGVLALPES